MKPSGIIPLPVERALRKLGSDLKEARLRRRLTMQLIEERAGITHVTLSRVEKGEPNVTLGTYAKVMFSLGLLEPLAQLADPQTDWTGQQCAREQLPQRVRYTKKEKQDG